MTATGQTFSLYAGDSGDPTVGPVLDGDGNVYDLSGLSEILWIGYTDTALPPTFTKRLTDSSITFQTDGTDGIFVLHFTGDDTTGNEGWYFHNATLVDIDGDDSTVETGCFAVIPRGAPA